MGNGDIIGDKIEDLTLMERKSMQKIIKIPAKYTEKVVKE